jgi:inhibitor of KinA
MEVIPLGDSTLLIRLPEQETQSVENVLNAIRRLTDARIPGVVELAPAYTTIALYFDPVRVVEAGAPISEAVDWLRTKIEEALRTESKRRGSKSEKRVVEIPVCYDREFGLDLEEVAQHAGLSPDETIRLHTAAEYRVRCVGFTPGFGFLGGLDPKLATPRRATPRIAVPPGSVAIGGNQTGVYPLRSPGGWNLIGRTPLRMFDVKRNPPVLLQAGDHVRFHAITREEFDSLGE